MASLPQASPERTGNTASRTRAGIACAAFTFLACYSRLFVLSRTVFPGTPILPGGDQLGFLIAGTRIVEGQLPYRDYFEFLPPGAPLFYAGAVRIFGERDWLMPLTMALLAAVCVLLMTLAAARVLRGFAVVLPALCFTGIILIRSSDATHHWFSTVCVLLAMLILLEGDSYARVFLTGAACGAVACFTQSKGATAVIAFVAYLIWKSWREKSSLSDGFSRCAVLCAGALLIFAAVNLYFVRAAGVGPWFFSMVTYPLKYYSAPAINNWRVVEYDFQSYFSSVNWIAFPFVYATVPLVYLIFLFVMQRRAKSDPAQPWDQLFLVALTGLGMFLAVATAPSVKRLCTVSPPAMVLLAWLLQRPGAVAKIARVGLAALAVGLAIVMGVHTQLRRTFDLNLPAGRTAFIDRDVFNEYQWVEEHTHPGEYFWGMPPYDVHFHLENPSANDALSDTEYTRPEQVTEIVHSLEARQTPLIVLAQGSDLPGPNTPDNHLGPFIAYLHTNYRHTIDFAGGDEVWERADAASPQR